MALIRQANVAGYLKKDIETYGILTRTDAGRAFQTNASSFLMMKITPTLIR